MRNVKKIKRSRSKARRSSDVLAVLTGLPPALSLTAHDSVPFFSRHGDPIKLGSMAHDLDQALERNELTTCFQAIVMADSGQIVGAELLLRWRRAEGPVAPALFIPIAETTGAILTIGAWAFSQACRAEVAWRARWGAQAPYVSVNLSTRQLDDAALVDLFAAILLETGAEPGRLLLEITETGVMTDLDKNRQALCRLAELGLRIAIDDFGTGYSSLAQLTRLPVHVLKIDKAFIDDIERNPDSRALIRAVIGLGRALGLTLVAEGVESSKQQLELSAYGCDLIQGYYFHPPLSEPAFSLVVERELGAGPPSVIAPLYFLIYASVAVAPLSAPELDELLQQARRLNFLTGLTGCLIYQDGCFMQMLEGEQAAVQGLMEKLRHDPRHRDLHIVIEGPARRRIFVDWEMARHDLLPGPDEPDFSAWPGSPISLSDLAKDPRTCYVYMTAYMHANRVLLKP